MNIPVNKKRPRLLRLISAVTVLALGISLLTACAANDDITALSAPACCVTGNAGEEIDLAALMLTAVHADGRTDEISAADLKIKSEGGKKRGDSLVFKEAGLYTFTVSSKNVTLNMYAAVKDAGDTDYLLFSETFVGEDTAAALADFTVAEGDSSALSLLNNGLLIDGTGGDVTVMLPDFLADFPSCRVNVKMKMSDSSKSSDRAGLVFCAQTAEDGTPESYYTMSLLHETKQNGMAVGHKAADKKYVSVAKIGTPTGFDETFTYPCDVTVTSEGVFVSYNYEDAARYESEDFAQSGKIGLQACGAKLWVDDIAVYLAEDSLPEITAGDYVNAYQPTTAIAGAASVSFMPPSADALRESVSAAARPASAVVNVDENLNCTAADGSAIGTVDELYELLNLKIIPIFSVDSTAAAEALSKQLVRSYAEDYLVMVKDAETIAAFKKNCPNAGFIYDFTDNVPSELLQVRDICNSAGARVALLPEEALVKADVEYLQRLALTVWGKETSGEGSATVRFNRMLTSGVQGIMTADCSGLIDVIESYSEGTVFMKKPFIISHRGANQIAPENSMSSLQLAYEYGAEIVECDIQVTKDGQLVISHDSEVDRVSEATGSIANMTLAELQQISIPAGKGEKYADEKFPSLEDFFKYIKGKDIVLDIEMKGTDAREAKELARLVEKYDIADQIFIISFSTSNLDSARDVLPNISLGNLSITLTNGGYPVKELKRIMPEVNSHRSSVNPSGINAELTAQLSSRGVTLWPWTYTDMNGMMTAMQAGGAGITTDAVQAAKDYICGISYAGQDITLSVGGSADIKAEVKTYGRTVSEAVPELVVIDGSDIIDVSGGTVTAKAAGEAYVLLKATQANGDSAYDVYSQPVKITVQ